MRFCPYKLSPVISSNPDAQRYIYGLHSVIVVDISFSSFEEGEMSTDVKLAICRHLGLEDPVYLGSSPVESKVKTVEVA